MQSQLLQSMLMWTGRIGFWLRFGPAWLVAALDDRFRQTRNVPRRINSAGGWIDGWRKGAQRGLIVGGVVVVILTFLIRPNSMLPALSISAVVAVCGVSVGGAFGFWFGGRDE